MQLKKQLEQYTIKIKYHHQKIKEAIDSRNNLHRQLKGKKVTDPTIKQKIENVDKYIAAQRQEIAKATDNLNKLNNQIKLKYKLNGYYAEMELFDDQTIYFDSHTGVNDFYDWLNRPVNAPIYEEEYVEYMINGLTAVYNFCIILPKITVNVRNIYTTVTESIEWSKSHIHKFISEFISMTDLVIEYYSPDDYIDIMVKLEELESML